MALQRFDVYYNHRIKALRAGTAAAGGAVSGAVGGVVGVAIGTTIQGSGVAAAESGGPFMFQNLVIDPDPLRNRIRTSTGSAATTSTRASTRPMRWVAAT